MRRPKSEPSNRKAERCLCLGGSVLSLQRLGALVPTRWNSYLLVLGALPSGVFLGAVGEKKPFSGR